MFFGVAFGVSSGKRMGIPVATIVLSNSTIAENAALGAAVGTLSVINATGTPAFTLVDSAGSRFALSGANVQRGATALDYEAATSHNIIVSVTGMTPSPSNATLNIQVTNIAEVPVLSVQPTLSPTSGTVGTLITCGTGTWTNTPTSYAYQWMRTGVDISGATSSTYTSVLADDTFTLTCKVLASNADGPAAGYSTTSNSHTVGAVALLLDSYTVGAAYSLRKLRTAYAGNCIRIRRSSDNAEQDFGFVSNVVDTAGIASFVGGGTGYIVTSCDQSGNGFDLTQATAANQPIYIASASNGKPTLRAIPTDQTLANASVTGTSLLGSDQATIMAVMDTVPPSTSNTLFSWAGSMTVKAHMPYGGTHYFNWGGDSKTAAEVSGWSSGASHVAELVRTTAFGMLFLADGVSVISATGTSITVPGTAGRLSYPGESGSGFTGDVPEIFFLKTDIGSTARNTLRADMGSYYGITVA